MNRKVNIYVKKQDGMHKHPKGDANKIQEGGGVLDSNWDVKFRLGIKD